MMNYELKIISMDEISKNKALKQYDVNGEKVVGCYENEAFMLRFKNNTWNKISVKFSIDGTDVLSGQLADTSEVGQMFMVGPYETLDLKCWPETNKGGSEFVFGKPEDSVAVNTHGIKSGIGYVAAAIFIEKVEVGQWIGNVNTFQKITFPHTEITWTTPTFTPPYDITCNSGTTINSSSDMAVYSSNSVSCSSPAVGAGEYVSQEIIKTAGLNKPILNEIISIKYEWWTSLRSKIRQLKEILINPAFPGDNQTVKMIDLKSTPRKKKNKVSKEVKYPELNRFG